MLYVRRAHGPHDVDVVAELWLEAASWLRDQGSDQWQYPIKMENVTAAIDAGTCWIACQDDDRPAATITIDTNADPQLWTTLDGPDRGLYVHRLVVRSDLRGIGLGDRLLDWAGSKAEGVGREFLRLDAWTTNTRLHQYYLKRAFRLVRIVRAPDVVSGALFERQAHIRTSAEPLLPESRVIL
jgi:GNAT superfamily N-acetyltransferase